MVRMCLCLKKCYERNYDGTVNEGQITKIVTKIAIDPINIAILDVCMYVRYDMCVLVSYL